MSSFEREHAVGANLDYGFNWLVDGWLTSGETISTSTWTVTTGLTLGTESNSSGITTVFVSGGVAGTIYKLSNTITTSAGRTDVRTLQLSCKQR